MHVLFVHFQSGFTVISQTPDYCLSGFRRYSKILLTWKTFLGFLICLVNFKFSKTNNNNNNNVYGSIPSSSLVTDRKLKNSSDFDYNDPTKIAPDSSVRWIPSVSNSCASGAKQSIGLTFSIQIQYLYNIIIPNFKCFHFSDKNCTILCNANLANFFLNFYWIANYFVIMVFEFVVKIIFVCFIFWLKKGEC